MNFHSIFYPQSIAIIGASTNIKSVGNDIVKNLVEQGFQGRIFPVNPKTKELYGLKCYANISEIEEDIELVIFVIPAANIYQEILKLTKNHTKGIIIISAGFKEVGNWEMENKIAQVCSEMNISLIGPNCLGVINPSIKLNASFASIMPAVGKVAFISQSGALCTAVLDYAEKYGLGFSKFISIGNKAQIDESDLLEYFASDSETDAVAVYLEDLKNPKKFLEVAKRMSDKSISKPLLVLKSGVTEAGAGASASHTGSLAGDHAAYQALFNKCGAIECSGIGELFDYLKIFSSSISSAGSKVAIVTNAGGPGVLAVDAIVKNKLLLANLSEETKNQLKLQLPPAAAINNPVDLLGDAKLDRYELAINLLLNDSEVEAVVVIVTPQSMTQIMETAQLIADSKVKSKKTIVACFMGSTSMQEAHRIFIQAKIPFFDFPEQAMRALAAINRFFDFQNQVKDQYENMVVGKSAVQEIFQKTQNLTPKSLTESLSTTVLKHYQIPTLPSQICTSSDQAVEFAKQIDQKIVMKISSPDILHKTDANCVFLDVAMEEIKEKYDLIISNALKYKPNARIEGVLMTQLVNLKDGLELIVGIKKDPLGHLLMIGSGGVLVEINQDISFGLLPLNPFEVRQMINSLKISKVIQGFRNSSPLDFEALVEVIGRLSQLVQDFPEISELDINPLFLMPKGKGLISLDARIILE